MTIKNMLVPVGDIERDEGAIGTALVLAQCLAPKFNAICD